MRSRFVLTHADAMKAIDAIRAELEKEGKGAAIAVADEHGEVIAFLRTDGCPLPSVYIAMNKAYTAARERKPSFDVGKSSKEKGWPMTNFGDLRYTAWGGGLPIIHDGQIVGAVGVSGLPEQEDIVLAGIGVRVITE